MSPTFGFALFLIGFFVCFFLLLSVWLWREEHIYRTQIHRSRTRRHRAREIARLEQALGIMPGTAGVCRQCQRPLQVGANYCAFCRAPVEAQPRICHYCLITVLPEARFCPRCGRPITEHPVEVE